MCSSRVDQTQTVDSWLGHNASQVRFDIHQTLWVESTLLLMTHARQKWPTNEREKKKRIIPVSRQILKKKRDAPTELLRLSVDGSVIIFQDLAPTSSALLYSSTDAPSIPQGSSYSVQGWMRCAVLAVDSPQQKAASRSWVCASFAMWACEQKEAGAVYVKNKNDCRYPCGAIRTI